MGEISTRNLLSSYKGDTKTRYGKCYQKYKRNQYTKLQNIYKYKRRH